MVALHELKEVFPAARQAKLIHSGHKGKAATFSATNEIEPFRPAPETPGLRNFYLAGDWTNTGLPATIEGAVLSGFKGGGIG